MRRLGLVVFLPYLFLALLTSASKMLWDFLPTFAAVFFSLIFCLVVITPTLFSPISSLQLQAKHYLQDQSFSSFLLFLGEISSQDPKLAESVRQQANLTEEQRAETEKFITEQSVISKEIAFWEKIYSAQNTHRDVLLNLATLYEASHQDNMATEMRKAAQQVDPNNPIFSQGK